MSTDPPRMRRKPMPRWSVVRNRRGLLDGSNAWALVPAFSAGLPASKAMVWVGPPFLASNPSRGLVTPI